MRYLVQLLIPALIVIGVAYVMTRRRQERDPTAQDRDARGDGEKGTVIVILVIGALVAIATIFALFGNSSP